MNNASKSTKHSRAGGTRSATDALFLILSTELGIKVKKDKDQNSKPKPTTTATTRGRPSPTTTTPPAQRTGSSRMMMMENTPQDASESGLRDDTNAHISSNDLSWSQEAPMLQKQLNNSRNKEVFTEIQFLLSFFRDLRLVDLKISHTDSLLSLLTSLTSLSLSGNHLSLLSHLPPSLLILNACANNILLLPDAVPPLLQHLGLGYNSISLLPSLPPSSSSGFSHLRSLDLSYNKLYSLQATLSYLSFLLSLRHLNLTGNPICLLPSYHTSVSSSLPWITVFDDVIVEKRANSHSTSPASSPPSPSSIPQPELFSLSFLLDYLAGPSFSSFLQAESPSLPRLQSLSPPSPSPSPLDEESLSSIFYFMEFEMPNSKEVQRSDPVSLTTKDSHKYDLNLRFSVTSDLYPDIPTALESEIFFYMLQCKLPHTYLQTHLPSSPPPSSLPPSSHPTSPHPLPSATKSSEPITSPKRTTKSHGGKKPTRRKSMAGNFVENSNLNSPAQDAGDAHGVLQIVAQLLKESSTNNSPLVITPLGRAQIDLSSLLAGQATVEQKCTMYLSKNVLQRQNLIEAHGDMEATLKIHVTLNP